MLSASSEVTLRKNLEGSRTQGLGPPSKSISFEEPRVTKATEEGSTACGRKQKSQRVSARSRPAGPGLALWSLPYVVLTALPGRICSGVRLPSWPTGSMKGRACLFSSHICGVISTT